MAPIDSKEGSWLKPLYFPPSDVYHGLKGKTAPERAPPGAQPGVACRAHGRTSMGAPRKKLPSDSFHTEVSEGECWPDKQPQKKELRVSHALQKRAGERSQLLHQQV